MSDFVDVDFRKCAEYVPGDLGIAPGYKLRAYGDVVPEIPEASWKPLIEAMDANNGGAERLVTTIYNQRNEGSCVANACCQALEVVQALQFGKPSVVHLSAMSVYKKIGSGPQSGAMVSDGLDQIAEVGALPLDNDENKARFKHTFPATGWSNKYPDGWQETAKNFRATEWFVCRGTGQLMTALLNHHPVVVGRSGHSICYLRPAYKSGKLGVVYANSWGEWGFGAGDFDAGFGFDSMGMVRDSADWAFAVRSVVTDPSRLN